MLPREIVHLADFAFGNIFGIHPANPHPPGVDMQHDLRRLLFIHTEEDLKDFDDKFHRRKVIVQKKNLIKRRPLEFWFSFLDQKVIIVFCLGVSGHVLSWI